MGCESGMGCGGEFFGDKIDKIDRANSSDGRPEAEEENCFLDIDFFNGDPRDKVIYSSREISEIKRELAIGKKLRI